MKNKELLLIGGNKDFNITRFAYFLRENNIPSEIIRYQIGNPVDLTLDVNNLELRINGKVSNHHAVFFRYDYFEHAENKSKDSLYHDSISIFETLRQYILMREDIKVFSRSCLNNRTTKLVNLQKAKQVGFTIPKTLVSSNIFDLRNFVDNIDAIQKPIDGGAYTTLCDREKFKLYKDDFTRPYLVQECLQQPEIRIYSIGEKVFPFKIIYDGIDYRANNPADIKVIPTEVSDDIIEKYIKLTKMLGLEYTASDFMTGENGELMFLEINNAPMFARVDEAVNGQICQAFVDFLLG